MWLIDKLHRIHIPNSVSQRTVAILNIIVTYAIVYIIGMTLVGVALQMLLWFAGLLVKR